MFNLFNVPVQIHWTYSILILFLLFSPAPPPEAIWGASALGYKLFLIFAISCSILIHEMGHALIAKDLGFPVKKIVFVGFGGLAMIDDIEKATDNQRALISSAGPLANVYAGIIAYIAFWCLSYFYPPNMFLAALALFNFIMAGFNLIPIFPLDGGRIFIAALSKVVGKVRAVGIATTLSLSAGVIIGLLSIYLLDIFLFFLAAFIMLASLAERFNSRQSEN